MDPQIQIRIRIHTKMSWIRNTAKEYPYSFVTDSLLPPAVSPSVLIIIDLLEKPAGLLRVFAALPDPLRLAPPYCDRVGREDIRKAQIQPQILYWSGFAFLL
jgi:hypothetical protein